MFIVIEVTDKGVQETHVNILSSENDTGYITKLENTKNYRAFDKNSATITGTLVPNNDEPF